MKALKVISVYTDGITEVYSVISVNGWPVQVEFVRQHPPVVSAGLRRVQTPAQLLPDGQRDPEGVRTHQCGDVTGRIQKRRVDALRVLNKHTTLIHLHFWWTVCNVFFKESLYCL